MTTQPGFHASMTCALGRARPWTDTFVLALNKAHVLALNTAHALRLNKADVLALNKAHVLRLNPKICPEFTANTKEAAFGKVKECCSQTSFSELSTGTGSSPRGGGRGQQKSVKVKECCCKTSFSELSTGSGSSPRGGARTAKLRKSEGVLLPN